MRIKLVTNLDLHRVQPFDDGSHDERIACVFRVRVVEILYREVASFARALYEAAEIGR